MYVLSLLLYGVLGGPLAAAGLICILFTLATHNQKNLRLISIMAARCVAWRERDADSFYISRHATQRAAVMEIRLYKDNSSPCFSVNLVCRQPVCHYVAPLLGGIKTNGT